MATSVSKTTLFTGNGPISFSQLSSTFRNGVQQNIRFSDYRRDTNPENPTPVIPDATENANISPDVDLRVGGFRGSIKRYDIIQSGSDATYNLGNSSIWNGNLNRNIIKSAYITGDCYATNVSNYGLTLDAEVYNLDVNVSGGIYGEGGTGGAPGVPGGTSTVVTTTTPYNIITVNRYSTARFSSISSYGIYAPSYTGGGRINRGAQFKVFETAAPGTVAAGYGINGYVFQTQQSGTIPIYKYTVTALVTTTTTSVVRGRTITSSTTARQQIGIELDASPTATLRTLDIYDITDGPQATQAGVAFYAYPANYLDTQVNITTSYTIGGSAAGVSGGGTDGGNALYLRNITSRAASTAVVNIGLNPGGRIWAGGGGGSAGNSGNPGPLLTCNSTNYFTTSNPFTGGRSLASAAPGQSCRRARSGATWYAANPNSTRSRCRGGGARAGSGSYQCSPSWTVYCQQSESFSTQGSAGAGGAGGIGRGYSNFNAALSGGSGSSGNTNSCGGGSSKGYDGNPGAKGGDWGEDSSGAAGAAIIGRAGYYRLRGDSTNTLKGKIRNI